MKLRTKLLIIIIGLVVMTVFSYLSAAFVTTQFDFRLWEQSTRVAIIVAAWFFAIIGIIVKVAIITEEKDKQ